MCWYKAANWEADVNMHGSLCEQDGRQALLRAASWVWQTTWQLQSARWPKSPSTMPEQPSRCVPHCLHPRCNRMCGCICVKLHACVNEHEHAFVHSCRKNMETRILQFHLKRKPGDWEGGTMIKACYVNQQGTLERKSQQPEHVDLHNSVSFCRKPCGKSVAIDFAFLLLCLRWT